MKQKLYILSVIGWTLTTSIVLLSLFKINLVEKFPYLFILFGGIFIVLIPAIFYAKNNEKIMEYEYDNNIIFNSGSIPLAPFFKNASNWILTILGLSFFTAIICFSKSLHSEGSTEIINSKYFLINRGNIIREITENEYEKINLLIIRGFFGMAMLFYSIPILVYKKLIEWDNNDTE
ncbi:hypothetical protein [Flavobacterium sp. GSA192]|uniref:hypothetical protein n=1 Tax=Flavobacterium sp. GSA192 TaxID=2576304 RepID=UPI00112EB619|nr:hypothetical protein [Flavobacterium sp. GSA192]